MRSLRTLFLLASASVLVDICPAIAESGAPSNATRIIAPGHPTAGEAGVRSKGQNDWSLLAGTNFRIWHNDQELAERVLAKSEAVRSAILRTWLPTRSSNRPWHPRCDVYLIDGEVSWRFPGVTPRSVGQADVVKDGSRVLRRRIVLNTKAARLIDAVIPHEVAHVVMGSYFPAAGLPLWADEGIAMLSEPESRQHDYMRQLVNRTNRVPLVPIRVVMRIEDYSSMPGCDFHLQSFALCYYLVQRQGHEDFIRFLEIAIESDTEAALRDLYGIDSMAELNSLLVAFLSELERV